MKPSAIYAVHPAGYLVQFALDEGEHVADVVERLVEREYRPSHGDAWARTPEGIPICPKHGEVMTQREKQGDTWYSHKVLDEHGEVLYCRGYAGKSSPGWSVPRVGRVVGRTGAAQGGGAQSGGAQSSGAQSSSAQGVGAPTSPASAGRPQPSQPQAPVQPQRNPAQQQVPVQPLPSAGRPQEPAAGELALPDYRQLAVDARTPETFDYAAYMTLRNGVYDSVERVAKARAHLVPGWEPSPAMNAALLLALEVYRDKRKEAEGRGEVAARAHQFAKGEALTAYEAMGQGGGR